MNEDCEELHYIQLPVTNATFPANMMSNFHDRSKVTFIDYQSMNQFFNSKKNE